MARKTKADLEKELADAIDKKEKAESAGLSWMEQFKELSRAHAEMLAASDRVTSEYRTAMDRLAKVYRAVQDIVGNQTLYSEEQGEVSIARAFGRIEAQTRALEKMLDGYFPLSESNAEELRKKIRA